MKFLCIYRNLNYFYENIFTKIDVFIENLLNINYIKNKNYF